MTNKLVIYSKDNPDWNGDFYKHEVEHEMYELNNNPVSDTDWICWVLGHMFDCKDFTGEIENFICNCNSLMSVAFHFNDGDVSIYKE